MDGALPHIGIGPNDGEPLRGREGALAVLDVLGRAHPDARAHGAAVSSLAVRIGRRLGLRGGTLDDLEVAGMLHDVGKLRVPPAIVEKPRALTVAEWSVVRLHPVEGERLLRALGAREAVLKAVRLHHERWDGSGYPDGLKGAATPLEARIVSVADAFAAMVNPRPYRPPLDEDAAVLELERCAGSQFDPACVEALVAAIGGGRASASRQRGTVRVRTVR